MLVGDDENAEVVGYLSPFTDRAGFVVPLFKHRASNKLGVQEVDHRQRVIGFRDVDPRDVHRLPADATVRLPLGAPALWGFVDRQGQPSFADRATLRAELAAVPDRYDDHPFLRLQIAQFCEDEQDVIDGWRNAYRLLAERSPRSAAAWRDVVVIPAQMRLAVETAILTHGLDASIDGLERKVEVDIRGNQLGIRLDEALLIAFRDSPAARRSLEESVAPMREAFHLAPSRVTLTALSSAPASHEPDVNRWAGIDIVAIGDLAVSLMQRVFPDIVESPRRSTADRYAVRSGAMRSGQRVERARLLLIEEGLAFEQGLVGEIEGFGPAPPTAKTVLILFPLTLDRATLDPAFDIAKDYRGPSRKVIAVIPQLPELSDEDGGTMRETLSSLEDQFDAIWILSDRSPYTRQGLPYGPARSLPAVEAHFHYLVSMVSSGEADWGSHPEITPHRAKFGLIGSALGDRTVPVLVQHAMMRLQHPALDLSSVPQATIHYDSFIEGFERHIHEIVRRDAPEARVTISVAAIRRPGPGKAVVALHGVTLRPVDAGYFEHHCVDQLRRHGWRVEPESRSRPMVAFTRNDTEQFEFDCKFVRAHDIPDERALRVRNRRNSVNDRVLFTNAAIQRRAFALQVLNGVVPIHDSRIEAAGRIFRNRYTYVLRTLVRDKSDALRLLVPAAQDVFNLFAQGSLGGSFNALGEIAFDRNDVAEIEIGPQLAFLQAHVHFVKDGVRTGTAIGSLRLDQGGWALEKLQRVKSVKS
jgi:hypothetical protein